MLTKKQKLELYDAGANDTYPYDRLKEGAEEVIDIMGGFSKLSDEEYQEAVEIYIAGFYGDDYEEVVEKAKEKNKKIIDFFKLVCRGIRGEYEKGWSHRDLKKDIKTLKGLSK